MTHLVLIRHGESQWNSKGIWTGLIDIPLDDRGKQEAHKAALVIPHIKFDKAYTSVLKRAVETLEIIKSTLNFSSLPTLQSPSLNERDYGDYTGKNKWELEKLFGQEKFENIRRGWDTPIPHGETLKDVYNRVVPYFKTHIEPELKNGKNIIICAHGNSLRALIKYLEKISDEGIEKTEINTAEVYVYDMDKEGHITSKQIRAANPRKI